MLQTVKVKTHARELVGGDVIAEQHAAGYVQGEWVVTHSRGIPGITSGCYLALLCRPTKAHHEWLSFCDRGQQFLTREAAIAAIAAEPGVTRVFAA